METIVIGSAVVSECGAFRYFLTRTLVPLVGNGRPMLFVMLNPSTADASKDDPTIRKCLGFAKRLGFGEINVVNLFAYRATDPADLARGGWQVGPDNSYHVRAATQRVTEAGGVVVCAWGAHARGRREASECLAMLRSLGVVPHALRLLSDGTPAHPLMLPYSCALQEVSA